MPPVVRILSQAVLVRVLAPLLGSLLIAGCSLKSARDSAHLSLVLPNPHRASLARSNVAVPSPTPTAPTAPSAWNAPQFICYGVNVTGAGIADTSANPDPNPNLSGLLAGTTSCAYRGIVSNGFTFVAGQTEAAVDLQIPPGADRVIQLIGITNPSYCASNFLETGGTTNPGAYEIGRVRTDLFGDTSVSIPITYFSSETKRVDCPNGSAATIGPAVAITSPAAGSFVNGANASTFTISGICTENGQPVTISGSASGSATCSAGAWSLVTPLGGAADGAITMTANLVNVNGVAAPPATINYVKDATAPNVLISNPPSIYANLGNFNAFPISGTCTENGIAVNLTGNITPLNPICTANVWSATVDFSGASEGLNSIVASQTDLAGNVSTPFSRTVTKDTLPPSPATGLGWIQASPTNTHSVNALWTKSTSADLGDQHLQFYSDATCTTALGTSVDLLSNTASGYAYVAPADGIYTYKVTAVDTAGNSSVSGCSAAMTLDTVAPTVAITAPAVGSFINVANAAAFSVSGTCSENGRNVVLSGPASATVVCTAGAWSATLNVTAGDGAVTLLVDHSDAAGNTAPQATRGFFKDTIPPALTFSAPTGGAMVQAGSTVPINLSVTEANPGAGTLTLAYSVNAGATWTTLTTSLAYSANPTFNWTVPNLPSGAGGARLRAIFADSAGNSTTVVSAAFTLVGMPTALFSQSNPTTAFVDECVGQTVPFSIQIKDAAGVVAVAPAAITITLSTSVPGNFYGPSDTLCNTPIATVVIPAAASQASYFFRPTTPGPSNTYVITAAAGGLTTTTQSLTVNDGGLWNPPGSAGPVRAGAATVLAGNQFFAFGGTGSANSGMMYDTTTNTWSPMDTMPTAWTTASAPFQYERSNMTAIWTGSKIVFWGGYYAAGPTVFNSGAVYNPAATAGLRWTIMTSTTGVPVARYKHSAVWTGTEMWIWGGQSGPSPSTATNSGGRYNPSTDTWTTITTTSAPVSRTGHAAVWTGSDMVVWGGVSVSSAYLQDGARFNSGSLLWTATTLTGAPTPRTGTGYAWSGAKMLVWGGTNGTAMFDGAIYDPVANSWTPMALLNAPGARSNMTAVWHPGQNRLLIWGGLDNTAVNLATGAAYDISTNRWIPFSRTTPPAPQNLAAGFFDPTTGHFAIWGGVNLTGPQPVNELTPPP